MLDRLDIMKLNELPIEQVAEALGLSVTRHRALCPFHDDSNPSLTFHRGKNRYRCFVCGASGGPIDLVMHYEHKDFLSACRWLADETNLVVPELVEGDRHSRPDRESPTKPFNASRYQRFFERPFLSLEARNFLFQERRLDPRVIRWCRLTSWKDRQGTPWLQIPYYDREGKLIGIQNRNLVKGAQPRFRFPSGAKCSIYNLQILNLLRPGETLFITEGASDCWAMLSSGYKAIAIPSATLLSRKDKELLQSLNSQPSSLNLHFAMYPDNDLPGERLFLQLQKVLPNLIRYQLPAGCKDFSEYYLLSLNHHPGRVPQPSSLNPQPGSLSPHVKC